MCNLYIYIYIERERDIKHKEIFISSKQGVIVRYAWLNNNFKFEDENNYTEPPDWAQPMRHYLGSALLKADQPEEAEVVYRRDLKWNQNNGWSLFGLHKALTAQNKKDEASQVYNQWQEAWNKADIILTASHK